AARTRPGGNCARAAAALPRAQAPRSRQGRARHVPDAAVRGLLRRDRARRVAALVGSRRAGADPARRRARLGSGRDSAAGRVEDGAVIEDGGVRVRRAGWEDVDFLVELLTNEEVSPFLSGAAARDRADLLDEIDRSLAEPQEYGRFVIEVEEDGEWRRAGALGFEIRNRRSRISFLQRLAVHPDFRGRRLGDTAARLIQRYLIFDLDYHRLELEVYGFNERAIAHAERSGFVREGVLFGLTREDLEQT